MESKNEWVINETDTCVQVVMKDESNVFVLCEVPIKEGEIESARIIAKRIATMSNNYDEVIQALSDIVVWTKVKNGRAEWKGSEEKIIELKDLLQKSN